MWSTATASPNVFTTSTRRTPTSDTHGSPETLRWTPTTGRQPARASDGTVERDPLITVGQPRIGASGRGCQQSEVRADNAPGPRDSHGRARIRPVVRTSARGCPPETGTVRAPRPPPQRPAVERPRGPALVRLADQGADESRLWRGFSASFASWSGYRTGRRWSGSDLADLRLPIVRWSGSRTGCTSSLPIKPGSPPEVGGRLAK